MAVANLPVDIEKVAAVGSRQPDRDVITVEEPLEIRLSYTAGGERVEQSVSVTMRTPGEDRELAVGFLAGEALIRRRGDVRGVENVGAPSPDKGIRNIVRVELSDGVGVDAGGLLRHFYTTSSCGVCGKASLDAVRVQIEPRAPSAFTISAAALQRLPEALRVLQTEFARTGGLHATASFTANGSILRVREDIGRHNAFDKLVGSYFLNDHRPETGVSAVAGDEPCVAGEVESAGGGRNSKDDHLAKYGILLSGRASFELLQKAAVAGVPLVASIGPPSSLAVELARDRKITLAGFLKHDHFNIYAGAERILPDETL